LVYEFRASRLDLHQVVLLNFAEAPKNGIAMARQAHISISAGKRRARDVPDRYPQCLFPPGLSRLGEDAES
jgi:hypothetical protein